MENFTPIASSIGGVLIGLSASVLLLFNGRIAGISGIFSGLLSPKAGEVAWRFAFVLGLVLGGLALFLVAPSYFAITYDRTLWMVALAGLIVGFGVRLGSGCTSGHGVCGISRLSPRSLVATVTFMATGALTVFLVRVLGGAS
ncbi:MAG TPA: YeeE/YedE family protein [Sandaracinaceae bacterium LLY-WYZ-13_1]|nr:YeeE/YedE family protein [Sandaracinaceae bacterium LLY-WYZ-13_1]